MNSAGLFFLLLFLLVIIPGIAFVGFTRWRAHQRGLPAPPLSAYNPFKAFSRNKNSSSSMGGGGSGGGGPIGWIKDKFASLRDHRAGSGYAGARRGERGFGPLDPDAAWDDRVALEADDIGGGGGGGVGADGYRGERAGGSGRGLYGGGGYEEQELGMHSPPPRDHGPYGMHGSETGGGPVMPGYGEERGRSRSREDLSYHGAAGLGREELDARYDQTVHGGGSGGGGLRAVSPRPAETSPSTSFERRSIFREEV